MAASKWTIHGIMVRLRGITYYNMPKRGRRRRKKNTLKLPILPSILCFMPTTNMCISTFIFPWSSCQSYSYSCFIFTKDQLIIDIMTKKLLIYSEIHISPWEIETLFLRSFNLRGCIELILSFVFIFITLLNSCNL